MYLLRLEVQAICVRFMFETRKTHLLINSRNICLSSQHSRLSQSPLSWRCCFQRDLPRQLYTSTRFYVNPIDTSAVTGPVARFARQIAGHGYVVVAPSSYHEFTGPEPLAYDGPGTDAGNEYKIQKVCYGQCA